MKKILISLILFCFAGVALAQEGQGDAAKSEFNFPNFKTPEANLITGGQPDDADLKALAERGVKTIINFRPVSEHPDFDEAAKVKALGMTYINIPMVGLKGATMENAALLNKALADNDSKVFAHCRSGTRAGVLFGMQKYLHEGSSLEDAVSFAIAANKEATGALIKDILENLTITATVNPDDVKSLGNILDALYDAVSAPKGVERDWSRMKGLFVEDGKLMPTGTNGRRSWSVEDYARIAGNSLMEIDFFEKEKARRVDTYGAITHVFSTYESRRHPSDKKPFTRGINSIQLFNDGSRWWIVNVFWQGETADLPLPKKYLK